MICIRCELRNVQTYSSASLTIDHECINCIREAHPDRAIGLTFAFPVDVIAHDPSKKDLSQ